MKIKDARQKAKGTKMDERSIDFEDIKADLNAVKQQVDRLNDSTHSLWNSLITFNGILIAIISVVVSLNPSSFDPIHLSNFLILSIGAIAILVLNFMYKNETLDKAIKKELKIIDLKINGIDIRALYGPPKPDQKPNKYARYYNTLERWQELIVKKSEKFAFMLTLIAVVYVYVMILKIIK